MESELKNFEIWEEVAMLSAGKLKKKVQSTDWSEEQRESISNYLETSETVKVVVKSLK